MGGLVVCFLGINILYLFFDTFVVGVVWKCFNQQAAK